MKIEIGIKQNSIWFLLAAIFVFGVSSPGGLGVFGWSAFKEDEHSKVGNGNNAMYDVLAAAEWLKREAAVLGADPERIVIFGESSGATDAQLMTLVPAARGLVSGKESTPAA